MSDHTLSLLEKLMVIGCNNAVDGDSATVPHKKNCKYKAICLIGSCASNVLDNDDLGWTVVNRGSNKSKTKT